MRLGNGAAFGVGRSRKSDRFIFTTSDITQSWTINTQAGKTVYFDWGDGSGIQAVVGTGGNQVITHNYAGAGTYRIKFFGELSALNTLYCLNNALVGSLDPIRRCTGLGAFSARTNLLACVVPNISGLSGLTQFDLYDNSCTGVIPPLVGLSSLQYLRMYNNNITGTIPSLTDCTSLLQFYMDTNSLTGYTTGTVSATCTLFYARYNALSQNAVDAILYDFYKDLGGRPGSGSIRLDGGTNSAPSATGLTYKTALQGHGWTVVTT